MSRGKGRNLGIRASGLSFVSICTESRIDDDACDAIIIECNRRHDVGLNPLVKRLHQRLIDTTIIVVSV